MCVWEGSVGVKATLPTSLWCIMSSWASSFPLDLKTIFPLSSPMYIYMYSQQYNSSVQWFYRENRVALGGRSLSIGRMMMMKKKRIQQFVQRKKQHIKNAKTNVYVWKGVRERALCGFDNRKIQFSLLPTLYENGGIGFVGMRGFYCDTYMLEHKKVYILRNQAIKRGEWIIFSSPSPSVEL